MPPCTGHFQNKNKGFFMHTHFRYYLRVRYFECDAQKVVFNARYGDYVDLAATYFLKTVLAKKSIAIEAFDFQTVKHTIEWQAPARFHDVLCISVHITQVGNTSFTFATEMRDAHAGNIVATTETVCVAVDGTTLTKKPLSEEIKALLLAGAPGVQVDHAGFL